MARPAVVFITQARCGSSRLPGKILKIIKGEPVLAWFLRRAMKSILCTRFCVATTEKPEDEAIIGIVRDNFPQIQITRGSETDVLARYHKAAVETEADYIVRVTSDCPFFDWQIVDECIREAQKEGIDAVRTTRNSFPLGMDVEVFSLKALETAHEKAKTLEEREHVGPYIFKTHALEFNIKWVENRQPQWPECRLTLDYPEDLELVERLYEEVGPEAPSEDFRRYLIIHPEVAKLNLCHVH